MLAGALAWETRSTLRALVPPTWLRRSLLGLLFVMSAAGCAAMALIPFGRAGAAEMSVGLFSGLLVANLLLAAGVAVGGAAALVRQPERFRLLEVAPVSPAAVTALPLASVLLVSLLPLALLFAPFVVAALRLDPLTAGGMVLAGAAAVAWAALLALRITLGLARRFGREQGARFATAFSVVAAFGALLGLRSLLRLSTGPAPVLVFLLLTLFLLPRLWRGAAGAFVALLRQAEPPRFGGEPAWGSPSWGRLLARTQAPWAAFGALPALLCVALVEMPWRGGAAAVLLVSLVMTPLRHLLAPEFERPERWRLAPRGAALRWSLLLNVGGPSALAALAAAAAAGWGEWAWVGGVAVLLALTPLTFTLTKGVARHTAQGALMLVAMFTEFLR
ncbi:MAG TPA: hypothetical protein VN228_18230 [Pyrinomonadaceae bacterium]|nr:hypothetical protein [Pyrinomonadaceae bacterium]